LIARRLPLMPQITQPPFPQVTTANAAAVLEPSCATRECAVVVAQLAAADICERAQALQRIAGPMRLICANA
jgi:hypothetical protein